MKRFIEYSLLSLLFLIPLKVKAVQCPIPNCPSGQLCFCPPPPPHYLVLKLKKSPKNQKKIMNHLIKSIKGNLRLTSEFVFRKSFRPKSYPANTPSDQISEWHITEFLLSNHTINIKILKNSPLGSKKLKTKATFTIPFVKNINSKQYFDNVNNISNQIMTTVYGRKFSAFGDQIAYVHKVAKNKMIIKMLSFTWQDAGTSGSKGEILSFKTSMNKEPSFSYDGKYMTFTSHIRFNPDLYLKNMLTGKIHRVSARSGVNHAAVFSRDMSKLAVTLDFKGNPDIFILRSNFRNNKKWRILKQITKNHAIDTSPAFSPNGKKIAFVSARRGRAQIYIKDLLTGKIRLLLRTSHRTYTPKWCKSGSREYLAFTQLIGNKSIIFIYNLNTKKGWRATSSSAPNAENPAWSKDCNLIAYESEKSSSVPKGIRVSPIQGGNFVLLYSGFISMPAWKYSK